MGFGRSPFVGSHPAHQMAIFNDVVSVKDGYRMLPQIPSASVRFLWHSAYCDGPLDGLLELQGKKYWYTKCDENDTDEGWYRRFLIVEVTEEQLAEEERWQKLFQQHVRPGPGKLRPKQEWGLFYDQYKAREPRDFGRNQVIGWFER
jgi:hypothetical protein